MPYIFQIMNTVRSYNPTGCNNIWIRKLNSITHKQRLTQNKSRGPNIHEAQKLFCPPL